VQPGITPTIRMFVKVAASGAVIHNTISGSKMKFYRAAFSPYSRRVRIFYRA